jgi:membrane associated rhomboid family serine protease
LKSIQWTAGGFFAFGLMAYLFFSWYMPNSRWEDYQYLVWAAAAVGGAIVGLLAARPRGPSPKPPTKEVQ